MAMNEIEFGAFITDRGMPPWYATYQDPAGPRFIVGTDEAETLQRLLKSATQGLPADGRYILLGPNGFRQTFTFAPDNSVTVVGAGGAPSKQIAPGYRVTGVGRVKEGEWVGTCPTRDSGPLHGCEADVRSWALDQSAAHKDAPVVVGPARPTGIQDPCSIYVRRSQTVHEHDLETLTSEVRVGGVAVLDSKPAASVTALMGVRDYIQSRAQTLRTPAQTEVKIALID